ncbi:NAD-dependent epimerase/dehydratase family protein [Actinomadura rupiterrae]|uniref:NAD-dependent epimerase/dehydratase family protein n=1 Tax=Actinomadura rupiterrae TaxID=559627 RepID=UPI0020A45871|nr:NAD(P)-dependent oxidoreductase [Actinomadura rupiterrae]MCP2343024.1 nucleoside-diphosphate-sugar epimerase [Actinomadura rupiterrae]
MRVLVAGATGVIGRRLVPLLKEVGHEPVALTRNPDRARDMLGVEAVVADALVREDVLKGVGEAAPDAVVNLLTAIPAQLDVSRLAEEFVTTNLLRTRGTRNLLDAAPDARHIAESVAFVYQPGDGLADEDAPTWHDGTPDQFATTLAAALELEEQLVAAGGLALRFGHLYGPGSGYAADGATTAGIKAGHLPLIGGGHGWFSFIHSADAATAIVAGLDRDVRGVLNVVDDHPVQAREWIPETARMLGAPEPSVVTEEQGLAAVGEWGVAFLNRLRAVDNARARTSLDWRPRYASWRDGFAAELQPGA